MTEVGKNAASAVEQPETLGSEASPRSSVSEGSSRMKVLVVVRTSDRTELSKMVAPFTMLSKTCLVSTVSETSAGVEFPKARVRVYTDYTFENAPQDFDVIYVPSFKAKSKRNALRRWLAKRGTTCSESTDKYPLVVFSNGRSVSVLRNEKVVASLELNTKDRSVAALNTLQLIHDVRNSFGEDYSSDHDEFHQAYSELQEIQEKYSSGDTAERLDTHHSGDFFKLVGRSMVSLVQGDLAAVILYEGIDELALANTLDIWAAVIGVNVIPLSINASVVKTGGGLRIEAIRTFEDFITIPAAANSLNIVVVPPCGKRKCKRTSCGCRAFIPKLKSDVCVDSDRAPLFLDLTELVNEENYLKQLEVIESKYSLPVARSVHRRLSL